MRHRALNETFYMAKVILGYNKLTVRTHAPICTFLDTCDAKRRLIQDPRSHFKTTIVTVTHRLQRALRDPSTRTLIVGDTDTNAKLHLGKIKRHLDYNVILRWLFSDILWEDGAAQAPAWRADELHLPGALVHGEPTFNSIGAGGGVVSRHYDTINPDDIIGDDEQFSEVEMAKTIEWSTGLESLFVPPIEEGQMDIPCTFWRTDDVYAFFEEFYGGHYEPVKTGPHSYQRGPLAVFRRAVRDPATGELIFPEAISEAFLARLREKNPERFSAQYMNDPKSSEMAYFKPQYLRYFNWQMPGTILLFQHKNGTFERILVRDLEVMSFCDPHAGGSQSKRFGGTRAAVITTGVQAKTGRVFVLDAWIKRAPTNLIITEIIRQNEQWSPQQFHIEANGLQKMIKPWLLERVDRERRQDVPYVPYIPKGDKDGERRIRGLQPLMRAGQIILQEGFNELIQEFMSWRPGTNSLRDGLDCLSQGLEQWGVGFDDTTDEEVEEYERQLRGACSIATGY